MHVRTILAAGCLAGLGLAQEKEPARTAAQSGREVCSIPLLRVTPPSNPYIPRLHTNFQSDGKMVIQPPAPPCKDDDLQGDRVSRGRDSRPKPRTEEKP